MVWEKGFFFQEQLRTTETKRELFLISLRGMAADWTDELANYTVAQSMAQNMILWRGCKQKKAQSAAMLALPSHELHSGYVCLNMF
jgi:hypothetical protein